MESCTSLGAHPTSGTWARKQGNSHPPRARIRLRRRPIEHSRRQTPARSQGETQALKAGFLSLPSNPRGAKGMPEITSDDGRYVLAVQGDRNVVVYDQGRPVWDRFSYEAAQAETSMAVTSPAETSPSLPGTPAAPTVSMPGVLPPGIGGRFDVSLLAL